MSEIVQMADNPAVFNLDSLQMLLARLRTPEWSDGILGAPYSIVGDEAALAQQCGQRMGHSLSPNQEVAADAQPVVPCQISRLRAQVAALEITNAGLLKEIAQLRAQLEPPPPPAPPAKPNPLHRALSRHARPSSHFDRRLPWGD